MDFNPDQTQTEIRDLTSGLLAREATQERLEAHERGASPYENGIWRAMARAGLLGICLPEEAGGAGLGPVELAIILRETGARVAPVPALSSLVAGHVIGRYGTAEQRAALTPLAEGEIALTFALREPGAGPADPPRATATASNRITGRASMVSYAAASAGILVPAGVEGAGVGLFLVAPDAVDIREMPLATGEPGALIVMDDAPCEPVGPPDGRAHDFLRQLALSGITATASGVLAGALQLTTEYVKTRRQFDRALAEFQAVTMQVADVYIATRALDVAMWSGAWRLAEGLPAEADLAVAAYHTADSALRSLYTCQHLHGGVGLDVTYPLHRYFAWGKHAAHLLGGAEAQLDLIGALV